MWRSRYWGEAYIKSPVATLTEGRGQDFTLSLGGNTSVSLSPTICGSVKFLAATIENPNSTTGNGEIKVIITEITTGVCSLDNQLLASGWAVGEGQLIARTAPILLCLPAKLDGRIPVCERVSDGPWGLVIAGVSISSATSRCSLQVNCQFRGHDSVIKLSMLTLTSVMNLPAALQVLTGAVTDPFPFHAQDGLQQSQYLVVFPDPLGPLIGTVVGLVDPPPCVLVGGTTGGVVAALPGMH